MTQLPQDFFNFQQEIQNKLAKVIRSVGKIDHTLYPCIGNEMAMNLFSNLHIIQNTAYANVRTSVA